ncbi:ferredoxin [Halopenitus sp. H-Gu1]|uniref:ferredoxin n=1 Tax=Halopenitus sp. H-Gu1 TaxID=3242697 RepID=UPI00359D78A4
MTTDSTCQNEPYRVTLDRDACEGIFACLVRDDRFREAADGLATIGDSEITDGTIVARFADDRLADAERAATACPVDAIEVAVATDDMMTEAKASGANEVATDE